MKQKYIPDKYESAFAPTPNEILQTNLEDTLYSKRDYNKWFMMRTYIIINTRNPSHKFNCTIAALTTGLMCYSSDTKNYNSTKDIIKYLVEQDMIIVSEPITYKLISNIDDVKPNQLIQIITTKNYENEHSYLIEIRFQYKRITEYELYMTQKAKKYNNVDIPSLFRTFCLIKSSMQPPKNKDNDYLYGDDSEYETHYGFYYTIRKISEIIGQSISTTKHYIDILEQIGLLYIYRAGSFINKFDNVENVKLFYALSEEAINNKTEFDKRAKNEVSDRAKENVVDKFLPTARPKIKIKSETSENNDSWGDPNPMSYPNMIDEIKELIDLGFYTEEEIIEQCETSNIENQNKLDYVDNL